MKKKRQNWNMIKADYLAGMSLDQISKKYGISIETLRTKIKRGKWAEEKKQLEAEALLRVKDAYVDSLVEHQVRARDRYVKYYIDASRKIMELIERSQDARQMVMLMNALGQSEAGEFRALGITDKSNEFLWRYVDHRVTSDNPQQPAHVIDIAIETLKKNNGDIESFIKTIFQYARLKGIDVEELVDKKIEDIKSEEPH